MSMSAGILLLVLGSLLLVVGIIGGGFEVKELKIPRVGTGSRILAGMVGALLIVIGVGINDPNSSNSASASPASSASGSSQPHSPWSPSPVSFSVSNTLGTDQSQRTSSRLHKWKRNRNAHGG